MRASTASPCQKCTSLYTFGSEFRLCRNIASDITSGIHAAAENPQRIIDTPPVGICVAPCICSTYFKRLTEGYIPCAVTEILNVSGAARMPLVPCSNEFRRKAKLAGKNVHGCTFLPCLRLIFSRASDLHRLFQKAYGGVLSSKSAG